MERFQIINLGVVSNQTQIALIAGQTIKIVSAFFIATGTSPTVQLLSAGSAISGVFPIPAGGLMFPVLENGIWKSVLGWEIALTTTGTAISINGYLIYTQGAHN